MAKQAHCFDANLRFPTLVVSKVRNIPVSKRQFTSPSRMIAFEKIDMLNWGLTTLIASMFFYSSRMFTVSWLSAPMILSLLCSCKPQISCPPSCLHWLKFTLRSRVSSNHLRLSGIRTVLLCQDSVRVAPVVLTAARRAPPVALFLPVVLLVTVPQRDLSDDVFFKRELVVVMVHA